MIGISGGVDSCFLAHFVKKELNLNPLVVHVDTGWNSIESVNNIEKIIDGLNLDLETIVIPWNEMRDLQLSFFKAQHPNLIYLRIMQYSRLCINMQFKIK